jgi:hypothetical protein
MVHSWIRSNEKEINMQDNELQPYIKIALFLTLPSYFLTASTEVMQCEWNWDDNHELCVGKDLEEMVMTTNNEQVQIGKETAYFNVLFHCLPGKIENHKKNHWLTFRVPLT